MGHVIVGGIRGCRALTDVIKQKNFTINGFTKHVDKLFDYVMMSIPHSPCSLQTAD